MSRGKRGTGRGGLTQYDRSKDAAWEGKAARAAAHGTPAPAFSPGGGTGCWCGSPFGHDWPGKAHGAGHPTDWPGRVNGWGYDDPRREP